MRAFLAIPLLPPALADFHSLRERLVADIDAVRWAAADHPHITMHFFGSLTADDAERAVTVLRPVAATHAPMTLWLAGLGSFPDAKRPGVLWCGVEGETSALVAVATACNAALRSAGFPVDGRPYRPHCTLGRPRQPWPPSSLARWDEAARQDAATSAFFADRAVLYESVGAATGVRHVARATLPLR